MIEWWQALLVSIAGGTTGGVGGQNSSVSVGCTR